MLNVFVVIFSIIVTLACLKYFIAPYVWICFTWFIVFLFFSLRISKTAVKFICLLLSTVIFTFGVYEGYLYRINKTKEVKVVKVEKNDKSKKYWISHDILGYAPQKNNSVIDEIYDHGKLIKKVVISIDENGLRISPPYKEDSKECILFFGGSVTFGDYVSDHETVPYLAGLKTGQRYQVYNFSFHGYGPHQMLSALEHGLVDNAINCKPKYIIYQSIWDHIHRAAGLTSWDKHGPKYSLNKEGVPVYSGHFDDGKIVSSKLTRVLQKSLIYNKIWNKYFAAKTRQITVDDENLYYGIVDKTRDYIETKYPGSEFHTICWDVFKAENYAKVIRGLQEKGIRVHLVSNIIPDIVENLEKYQLSFDVHPNPLAYDIIAEYVSNSIVKKGADK